MGQPRGPCQGAEGSAGLLLSPSRHTPLVALPAHLPPLLPLLLDLPLWCGLWAWPGPWLCTLVRSAVSPQLCRPLCPSPVCTPPRLCLAQGRLSEEIEKLRQEVDQLKSHGGPFVDGVHPRYWSVGGWACWEGSCVDPEERDFLPLKDCPGPQGPPPVGAGCGGSEGPLGS